MTDFIIIFVVIGIAVAIWVVIVRARNKHATDDETRGRLPRRRRGGRPPD